MFTDLTNMELPRVIGEVFGVSQRVEELLRIAIRDGEGSALISASLYPPLSLRSQRSPHDSVGIPFSIFTRRCRWLFSSRMMPETISPSLSPTASRRS